MCIFQVVNFDYMPVSCIVQRLYVHQVLQLRIFYARVENLVRTTWKFFLPKTVAVITWNCEILSSSIGILEWSWNTFIFLFFLFFSISLTPSFTSVTSSCSSFLSLLSHPPLFFFCTPLLKSPFQFLSIFLAQPLPLPQGFLISGEDWDPLFWFFRP